MTSMKKHGQAVRLPAGRRTNRAPPSDPLRFSPYAWAKLLYLRDRGETEVGGFGISNPDDLLLIEDFCLVRQECTEVTVRFDDESVADYFDAQVDVGLAPEQFGRIWIHTHPGSSPYPSSTDEATFARCFGQADWAVMFIVAAGGKTYARLKFAAGPGGEFMLPVEVDFSCPFTGAESDAWEAEYLQNVSLERELVHTDRWLDAPREMIDVYGGYDLWGDHSSLQGPRHDGPGLDDPRYGPNTARLVQEGLYG